MKEVELYYHHSCAEGGQKHERLRPSRMGLDEFISRRTPPGIAEGGMLNASGMSNVLHDLHNLVRPYDDGYTQSEKSYMWVRGGSVIEESYGKDAFSDAPTRVLEKLTHATIANNTRKKIENHVPDLDIYMKFKNGVKANDVEDTLIKSLSRSTEGTFSKRDDGAWIIRNGAIDDACIELSVHEFGDPTGQNNRIMANIVFVRGNEKYAIEIAQDLEEDLPLSDPRRRATDGTNMRLNVYRDRLDVLGTYPVYDEDGKLYIDTDEVLHGNNPYLPTLSNTPIGFSQVFNTLVRAARITAQHRLEEKFEHQRPFNDNKRRGLAGLILDAKEASSHWFEAQRKIVYPQEDNIERQIFEERSLPLAKQDIVVGLARNPFRFLIILMSFKGLVTYMPIDDHKNVMEEMLRLFGNQVGRHNMTLFQATELYESEYLQGGMGQSGLDMLAQITGVHDVVSLFVSQFE